jgi:hypothetical protein
VELEVEALVVVMVVIQGGFGGWSILRRRWERYIDLVLGLVEKKDEEVEEGVGLKRK